MSAVSISQDFSNDQDDLSSDDSLGEFWPPVIIYHIYKAIHFLKYK